MLKKRQAQIISITPSQKYMDGIVEKRSVECVTVKDETGELHFMITGSINSIPIELRKVGQKGVVHWVSTSTYAMWFFRGK